jgi:hypothetical protein
MKLKACVTVLLVLMSALVAAPPANAAIDPSVRVSRTTDLVDGTEVTVSGAGITPGATVRVIECARDISPRDDPVEPCPALRTVQASSIGKISVMVKLVDLTFNRVFGADEPVYCRNDGCHIILVWTVGDPDDPDSYRSVLSEPLEFSGSAATIYVSPARNLSKVKTVRVTGTAYGAEGRTIKVLEQACYDMVQGNGCYGQLSVRWGKVKADGTYKVEYPAQRHLAGGEDCVDPDLLGSCLITTVILDSRGRPDDSFGVSSLGDPRAAVTFRGLGVSPSSDLSGGDSMTFAANGVRADTDFQVVQCDYYVANPTNDGNCIALSTARSDSSGSLRNSVQIVDLIYHEFSNGDKTPVYCRDDRCRIFLVALDEHAAGHVVAQSAPLEFTGSAATIAVKPLSGLAELQWVTVTGSARGAEGHTIQVVEQACFPRKSFEPCYGQLPVKWAKVADDGTFRVKYPARRYLADDTRTDCRNTGTTARCRISVIVLGESGRHDDSFGVKHLGQPGKAITLAATT